MAAKGGVFSCGFSLILQVITENIFVLCHSDLVVPSRSVGGKRAEGGWLFETEIKWAARYYFK